MCNKRTGQLLRLSALAFVLTACGQKGDLFLPDKELPADQVKEQQNTKEQQPEKKDLSKEPIMEKEKQQSLETKE